MTCVIFTRLSVHTDYGQIIAKQPMPDNIRNDLAAYVGCIAGAISIVQYKSLLEQAGFKGGTPPLISNIF